MNLIASQDILAGYGPDELERLAEEIEALSYDLTVLRLAKRLGESIDAERVEAIFRRLGLLAEIVRPSLPLVESAGKAIDCDAPHFVLPGGVFRG